MSRTETESERIVATGCGSGNNTHTVFHTDPDCVLLHDSETRPVRPVEIDNKGLRECAQCRGEIDHGTQPDRTCPVCGDTVRSLPRHLRHNCDGRP